MQQPIVSLDFSLPSTLISSQQMRQQQASERVLLDLLNALLLEDTFNLTSQGEIVPSVGMDLVSAIDLQPGEHLFRFWLEPEKRYLLFAVTASVWRSHQSRLPVVLVDGANGNWLTKNLSAVEVITELANASRQTNEIPNLEGFLAELGKALEQTVLSLEAISSTIDPLCVDCSNFIALEQLASWRDRPFHPTARAKVGWDEAAYRRYSPEFNQTLGLAWVAVRRDYIMCSPAADKSVAELILNQQERAALATALQQAGIAEADYVPLPVHPWQQQQILPQEFAAEIQTGICVPLQLQTGAYLPTSSLRSLAPVKGGEHVKLPISIYSLGALRLLPTRYLINGEKGQNLLQQVIEKQPSLEQRVYLCDETKWWSFCQPDGDLFDDKPGHLGCLLRQYPSSLLADSEVNLIPMSALAVHLPDQKAHLFSQWLNSQTDRESLQTAVLDLFAQISREAIVTGLTFLRYGIMPELHGQNVVLVMRDRHITGLVLRDHDTVRIHLPWMQQVGIKNPQYLLKENTPNTLVNGTPEELLAYFQTLVLQVNLAAIIDALSQVYNIDETEFWHVIESNLKQAIASIDFTQSQKSIVEQALFVDSHWPFKQIINPLLKRQGTGGGGMPSARGKIMNPLHNLERRR